MRLSVSLVTYMQSPEELRPVMESVTHSPLVERLQIIDNSPTNELEPFLNRFPSVEYLHNPSNPGFGASHNIALRRSLEENIPYHLIVNPDVSFDSSILDELVRYMDETHEAGLIPLRSSIRTDRCSTIANCFPHHGIGLYGDSHLWNGARSGSTDGLS